MQRVMHKKRPPIGAIVLTAVLFVIGIGFIFPFIFILSSSFKISGDIMKTPLQLIPQNPTLRNFHTVFNTPMLNFGTWYMNTITMVSLTILFKTFVVTITGYAFAKIKFKGSDIIFLTLLSALMIPSDIMIIPRYIIFSRLGITDSTWALVLPYTFDIYFVFLIRQFFLAVPDSITEAAEIDGCSHFRIYRRIVLPLAVPAIITMVLFTFVWAWNDYMTPYIFINNTDKQMLTVGMQLFTVGSRQNYGAQMAAAALILLPIITVFLFCQRFFIQGIATSGVKG
jgi:ABC-type sugar transport system, permease component